MKKRKNEKINREKTCKWKYIMLLSFSFPLTNLFLSCGQDVEKMKKEVNPSIQEGSNHIYSNMIDFFSSHAVSYYFWDSSPL